MASVHAIGVETEEVTKIFCHQSSNVRVRAGDRRTMAVNLAREKATNGKTFMPVIISRVLFWLSIRH